MKPSIVLVFADQWRADAVGSTISPHLQALMQSSTTFSTCITNAPLCRPARITVMTGQSVAEHRYSTNLAIPEPHRHPSHVRDLRDAGYRTVLVGKSHLTPGHGHLDEHRERLQAWGFDDVVELPDAEQMHVRSAYSDWLTATTLPAATDKALLRRDHVVNGDGMTPSDIEPWRLSVADQLDSFCARAAIRRIRTRPESDRPLYLQVNFPGPHPPFDAPTRFWDQVDPDQLPETIPVGGEGPPLPSRQVPRTLACIRQLRHAYAAKVALVDHGLGQILGALEEQGLMDETWIMVTADHGELLGDHGLTRKVVPYEGSLRVPLVVRPPGGTRASRVAVPVDLRDVVQTIRAIAGLSDHAPLDRPRVRPLVAEAMGLVTVRTASHKAVWSRREGRWVGAFDLVADPSERHNQVDEPSMAEILGDAAAFAARSSSGSLRRHRSRIRSRTGCR